MGKALKLPKTKCCVASTRCDRCPIRMLKEGDLPAGYGVHRRKLVRVDVNGKPLKKKAAKAGKKITKSELATAVKKTKKSAKKAA